jgi:radical SAM superfamily enzyme YgiQ (UPF0313 family)
MALAGWVGVFVEFESLNDENLKKAGKRVPGNDTLSERVRLFHDYGIQVNASFVLGFDHDDPGVFSRTIQWAEDNRVECATFHILTPYPRTPLFRKMKKHQRMLHENWELYDTAHVVFLPEQVTPTQLKEVYSQAYRKLFTLGCYLAAASTGLASGTRIHWYVDPLQEDEQVLARDHPFQADPAFLEGIHRAIMDPSCPLSKTTAEPACRRPAQRPRAPL